jgi:hypothetical protein
MRTIASARSAEATMPVFAVDVAAKSSIAQTIAKVEMIAVIPAHTHLYTITNLSS